MISLYILKGIWHISDICQCFFMSFLSRQSFHDEPMMENFHHHIQVWLGNPMWVPLNPTNPQRLWDALFPLTCSEIGFRQGIYWDMPHLTSTKNLVSSKGLCAVLFWLTLCITLHMRMWSGPWKLAELTRINPSISSSVTTSTYINQSKLVHHQLYQSRVHPQCTEENWCYHKTQEFCKRQIHKR